MHRFVVFILMASLSLACAATARAAERQAGDKSILFSESFEDADLASRGWYDGTKFRIVGDAAAGKGCIEYE